ncbi:MAG: autotransporter-associated beta strand repeat-containing protein [Verrucomicrobiota bacterium]
MSYNTASTSRPNAIGLAQPFSNFDWNYPSQSGNVDFSAAFTNANGNLSITAGASGGINELKLNGSAVIGGDILVNSGSLNLAGSGGPYTWTLKSNLTIAAQADLNLTAGSSGSYTLVLNGSGVQTYACLGTNRATKLNWTVNSGSTLNLSNDLSLAIVGRTLAAVGNVNLNGRDLATDLVTGTGIIANQGGGTGHLNVGTGNGTNLLDGTLSLVDGTSGTLSLIKSGSGLLTITANNVFSGGLTVSNGTVLVNNTSGSGTGTGPVTVLAGSLGGTGIISGAVTVQGGKLSPGNSIGRLTVNNTVTLLSDTSIEIDKSASTNDQVVATVINYGGTLTVTNLNGSLVAGDSYTIFSAGSFTGNFSSIIGVPGQGLAWSFNPTNGTITVEQSIATTPTNLVFNVSGSNLALSWPTEYLGWVIEAQTNSLASGISANTNDWHILPGTELVTATNLTIDPANPTVFFRMRLP